MAVPRRHPRSLVVVTTLLEECDFEFPPGHHMRCNDWRLDLFAAG